MSDIRTLRLTGREGPLDLIRVANTIDITNVLADVFGTEVWTTEGKSAKVHCPFGFTHADGGTEKAMRVYAATNSCFCFDEHGWMDPVRLMQVRDGLTAVAAARSLIRRYGSLEPMPYWQRFAELERERHEAHDELGEVAYAVEALQVALRAHEAHARLQYTPAFTAALERALDALNHIAASKAARTQPDILRRWFERARTGLAGVLDRLAEAPLQGDS